jgi:large subunit ribosomal protein L35
MKKQKTRKSISRRFKITKTGKILRRRSGTRHLRVKKSRKQKRRLKNQVAVKKTYAKKLAKVIGIKKNE